MKREQIDTKQESTTHFGFEQVAVNDKVHKVAGVFDSVADQYDVMN
ncbi:MAG TPA: bifunctional demethylmenaquinone methyltransferase/2-methoxy-6-polyprenyl-1,4-benzoquinol methylase UbiE, partial [Gammaproteobacteria bacterium]|nr:bifunctional demethylmenaquinone methyltransferase/2-methoxy-6-polyprenyl-1,4-benzoquinol methylase UbiE [Gammaproteobacteria bacterium]